MTEQEMKETLKTAANHAAPDILDDLLAECKLQPKGTVIVMERTKKRTSLQKILGLAAALVLIAAAAFAVIGTVNANAVTTTVALDVNPSIEITLKKDDTVKKVTPLNDDAKIIVGDMDFRGDSLEKTVNALIGSMLKEGYLNEAANSILVSVENRDPEKAENLQKQLTKEINDLLNSEAFQGSVVCQTVTKTDELTALAEKHNISVGKAELINHMIKQNPLYTFEDLAPLSINDLNLLASQSNAELENTQTAGTASNKAYADPQKAVETAKAQAGVTEIYDLEWELDSERGTMVYEIEFKSDGKEYGYEISAADGTTVIKTDRVEYDDDKPAASSGSQQTNTPSEGQPADDPSGTAEQVISAETAKKNAFAHAGINASDAKGVECELDRDDGTVRYEIEFQAKGYEYDYEVDAYTGAIVKSEKEFDD